MDYDGLVVCGKGYQELEKCVWLFKASINDSATLKTSRTAIN
jgi:hypothetical protein